jgi:hypothetical protein
MIIIAISLMYTSIREEHLFFRLAQEQRVAAATLYDQSDNLFITSS